MSYLVEKELSDNEIVKIFECCYTDNPCEECPAYIDEKCTDVGNGDIYRIPRLVADLINRQELKIKGLNRLLYSFLDTRNGDLVHITDQELEIIIKPIKTEAYKEFVERVCEDRVSNDPVVIAVKCELKELVGDNKCQE